MPDVLRYNIKRILAQKEPKSFLRFRQETTYAAVLYPFRKELCKPSSFDISFRAHNRKAPQRKQYLSLSNLSRISLTCKNLQKFWKSALLIAKGLLRFSGL